ncbi:MAG TPA: glycosyltransferase family 9 protein [Candidatus Aquilonibacter sp.]|nr:glycosyltransferase family 9 protein [Candidatus Aquilonibacter sp.]
MRSAITTRRPRLVMLRALALGDFLTAVPAYRALARAFPGHYRVLAAPVALAPLAELCGDIDEVVDTAALSPLDPALAGADVAVNLHGRGPQSHRLLLETEPRRLIAFAHPDISGFEAAPAFRQDEHEVRRWCRLLEESGIRTDPRDLDLRAAPYCGPHRGAVVLHCGASSESRRWPIAAWIELAAQLHRDGYRVVFTGTQREFRRARVIARNAGVPIDRVTAGRTTVTELVSLVAAARAVVCGDTGVAHVATAVGTPSVVLFGPISPASWGPPRERRQHRVLWRGRIGDPHAAVVDPGLASITVEEVRRELDALLDTPRAG